MSQSHGTDGCVSFGHIPGVGVVPPTPSNSMLIKCVGQPAKVRRDLGPLRGPTEGLQA